MKKKIGIITIVKVNNYGAELQAYALQKKLNLLGYDAEIIDYLFYKNKAHIKEKISRPFYPYPIKKKIKEFLEPWYHKIRCLPYWKNKQKREKAFDLFHKKHTRFSSICYRSYSQLYQNPPIYDVYCVGSDQVWNPGCYTNLNPYFVSFAPRGKKRISYASSFGVKVLPQHAQEKYKDLLLQMDAISVREDAGVDIVNEISGRDAVKVADPTLLLTTDDWLEIANYDKVPTDKYILLYVLKDSDYIKQKALEIGREQGLKVVRICKEAYKQDKKTDGIIDILDAAPDDFLGLFSKAEIVLTNSFHGTVFSIMFRQEFYTVMKRGVENNSRQLSLLKTLNIDRIRYENDGLTEGLPIQWENVHDRLDKFRKDSLNYLINAIDG